jgi:hypothetical protein
LCNCEICGRFGHSVTKEHKQVCLIGGQVYNILQFFKVSLPAIPQLAMDNAARYNEAQNRGVIKKVIRYKGLTEETMNDDDMESIMMDQEEQAWEDFPTEEQE